MITFKNISLHPKLAGILDVCFGLMSAWWATRLDRPWLLALWFFLRILWWAILLLLMYYPLRQRRLAHWFALAAFNFGLTIFLIFLDWRPAWNFAALLYIIIPVGSFFLVPAQGSDLSFLLKPLRRWRFLMTVIAVAGIWTGVEAGVTLQIIVRPWSFAAVAGAAIATSALSAWWWREYELAWTRRLAINAGLLALLMGETGYATLLWPIGYLSSGFLLVWLWYLLWLIMRFNLSSEGINWKKQAPFLVINAVLILIYLSLIVRWR